MPRGFDDLGRAASRPDRLADEPAATGSATLDPLTDCRNDPAGIATELAHVEEVDGLHPTIEHRAHRFDLLARDSDEHRLLRRDTSLDESTSPRRELLRVAVEQCEMFEREACGHDFLAADRASRITPAGSHHRRRPVRLGQRSAATDPTKACRSEAETVARVLAAQAQRQNSGGSAGGRARQARLPTGERASTP